MQQEAHERGPFSIVWAAFSRGDTEDLRELNLTCDRTGDGSK